MQETDHGRLAAEQPPVASLGEKLDVSYLPSFDWAGAGTDWTGAYLSRNHEQAFRLASEIPGFLRPEDAQKLYELAWYAPGPILEIGTHQGRSAALMAQAAVDSGREIRLVSVELDGEVLRAARRNLASRGLGGRVTLIEGTSRLLRAGRDMIRPGFVFVDGDHSFRGVQRDLTALEPIVPRGAIIAMHDYMGYEDADPFYVQVKPACDQSWLGADCEFIGRFGLIGLFVRRSGGPASVQAQDDPLLISAGRARSQINKVAARYDRVARLRIARAIRSLRGARR